MALMAAAGEITPMPQCAIFADTQDEPASVYKWLDWLEKQLPFPVHRVTAGSLSKNTLRIHERKDKLGTWNKSGVPHYSINADGSNGHGPRQCTSDFKLAPIQREQRRLIKEAGLKKAICWIGISLDEVHRMKLSGKKYLENRWPMVELRMRRYDCLQWMKARGYPQPPRSACLFCPYHNDAEWQQLKTEEPEEFAKAVEFEKQYQFAKSKTVTRKGFTPFLHAKRIPLDQIDFDGSTADWKQEQLNGMGQECEGLCGV